MKRVLIHGQRVAQVEPAGQDFEVAAPLVWVDGADAIQPDRHRDLDGVFVSPPITPLTLRLATDADGPAIGALFHAAHLADLGVDWTAPGVGGWWLVAERDGNLLGAIQVCAGKPFGFIGDIVVHPSAQARGDDGTGRLSKRPGTVGFTLCAVALKLLKEAGTQVAIFVADNPALKAMLVRYDCHPLGEFTLFAKGLRP